MRGKELVGSRNERWGPGGRGDEQRREEAPSFTQDSRL